MHVHFILNAGTTIKFHGGYIFLLLAEKFLYVTSLSARLFRIFIPRRRSGTRGLTGVCFGNQSFTFSYSIF